MHINETNVKRFKYTMTHNEARTVLVTSANSY